MENEAPFFHIPHGDAYWQDLEKSAGNDAVEFVKGFYERNKHMVTTEKINPSEGVGPNE